MATTAIILAGGRGDRMGGRDKGWIDYRGTPLIEHVIGRLRTQVDHIVISCNRSQERYRQLGYPVVSDPSPDYPGPLAGIGAAAALCRDEWALLCPCDTPLLPTDLVQRLQDALAQTGATAAVPSDGEHAQYLNALVASQALASAVRSLEENRPAVKSWLGTMQCVEVDFSDCPGGFTNINRPADLPP